MSGGRGLGRPRPRRRTLACLLQAVIGSPVVVELRDDGIVRGTLAHADEALNLALTDATWTPLQGPPHPPALYLHLRSPAVRFVHLPPSINPRTAVDDAERAASAARAAARRAALAAEGRAGRLGKGMDAEVGAFGGSAGLDGDQEEGWAEGEEEGGAEAAAGGGG